MLSCNALYIVICKVYHGHSFVSIPIFTTLLTLRVVIQCWPTLLHSIDQLAGQRHRWPWIDIPPQCLTSMAPSPVSRTELSVKEYTQCDQEYDKYAASMQEVRKFLLHQCCDIDALGTVLVKSCRTVLWSHHTCHATALPALYQMPSISVACQTL